MNKQEILDEIKEIVVPIKENTCFGNIYDEYGSQITAKEFWDMVLEKQKEKPNTDEYCETIDGFNFCREDFD